MAGRRLVVRVAGVRVDGHDRRVLGLDAPAREVGQHPLLHAVLGQPAVDAGPHVFERRVEGGHEPLGRGLVVAQVAVRPARDRALDQVGRRDDLDPERSYQLDGAGVGARDDRQHRARRVVHGQAASLAEEARQRGAQLLPGQVGLDADPERLQRRHVDAVDQQARVALARDQQVAAPGRVARHAEQLEEDRVLALEVVEQPAVEPGRPQPLLGRPDARGRAGGQLSLFHWTSCDGVSGDGGWRWGATGLPLCSPDPRRWRTSRRRAPRPQPPSPRPM